MAPTLASERHFPKNILKSNNRNCLLEYDRALASLWESPQVEPVYDVCKSAT